MPADIATALELAGCSDTPDHRPDHAQRHVSGDSGHEHDQNSENESALFRLALDRYDAALASYTADPARAVAAFFDVVLDGIADPAVPDGCLIAHAAAQAATLEPDSRERVRAALNRQCTRVRAALADNGITSRQATELAWFVVAVSQSLGLLNRVGTGANELRAIARTACDAVRYGYDRARA